MFTTGQLGIRHVLLNSESTLKMMMICAQTNLFGKYAEKHPSFLCRVR